MLHSDTSAAPQRRIRGALVTGWRPIQPDRIDGNPLTLVTDPDAQFETGRTSMRRPRGGMTRRALALALLSLALALAAPAASAAFLLPPATPSTPSSLRTRTRGLVRATAPPPPPPASSSVDAASTTPTIPTTTTTPTQPRAFGERTRQILDGIQTQGDATGGAGSSIAFSTLEAMDRAWAAIKSGKALEGEAPTFVRNVRERIQTHMCRLPRALSLTYTRTHVHPPT
jgi:hypothetical protein